MPSNRTALPMHTIEALTFLVHQGDGRGPTRGPKRRHPLNHSRTGKSGVCVRHPLLTSCWMNSSPFIETGLSSLEWF